MKKRLKINGIIVASAVLLTVIFPTKFLRTNLENVWEEIMEVFGITFILLGQIIRVSARGYKSEYSQQGDVFIKSGPYALVRHPMYLGILFIGVGIVLMLFNWWVVAIFLFVFITRYWLLIFKEEKKLIASFGEEYQDYCRRLPRILPSLERIFYADVAECLPLKWSWLKKELGTILAVLLTTLFIESREDVLREGLGIYLKESVGVIIIFILFLVFVIYLSNRTKKFIENAPTRSKDNL